MVMNQVTLLCAESFNDVSLLGALTSCPLLKERGYQTEILYCGDENDITKEAGDAVSVIRLKLDSLKEALLATNTRNLLLSFADKQVLGLLFRLEEIGFLKEHKIRILGTSLRQYRTFYHQADQKSFYRTWDIKFLPHPWFRQCERLLSLRADPISLLLFGHLPVSMGKGVE